MTSYTYSHSQTHLVNTNTPAPQVTQCYPGHEQHSPHRWEKDLCFQPWSEIILKSSCGLCLFLSVFWMCEPVSFVFVIYPRNYLSWNTAAKMENSTLMNFVPHHVWYNVLLSFPVIMCVFCATGFFCLLFCTIFFVNMTFGRFLIRFVCLDFYNWDKLEEKLQDN